MRHRMLLPLFLVFAISGCVTIPESLQGDYLQETLPDSITEEQRDQPVRWGGTLLGTLEGEQVRCMVLLARPLDDRYRPLPRGEAAGRFLACDEKSIETDDFFPGGDVTVVGVFEGIEESVDDDGTTYFPIVRMRSAYAWPMNARPIEPFDREQQGARPYGAAPRSIDRYINR